MRMDIGLVGLAGCAFDWILSRPWKLLSLYFIPLVLAISTIGLATAGNYLNRDNLTEKYLRVANEEVKEWEDQWEPKSDSDGNEKTSSITEPTKSKQVPASAEMLFRRIQQLQNNDSRSMFFVALCYLQRGATSQGMNILNRLAPTDRIGYPPAHAYVVEQMLSRPLSPADIPLVRHHAEGAMRWSSVSPQLLATISDLFSKLNEQDKAILAMGKAAERDKKYYLLLAELARRDKKTAKLSEESLEKAIGNFTEKLDRNPQDVPARLMLADAQRIGGNDAAAEWTILEGIKVSGDPVLKSALSELYCQIFAKSAVFKEDSWTGDIELLEKAFQLDPNNMHIFEEVARLARISGKVENEPLMAQLRQNLTEGRATSVTHMWIAEHYLNANQFAKAIPHLEQAVKRDPNAARCWNNLAYCLADIDPDRLDEALKDVDRAIALTPLVPDYYDTRGTILMKMRKPGDAVAAFERAVELIAKTKGAIPPQPAYHERLAEAYAAVGDQAMADTHKNFAADLLKARAKAIADAQAAADARAKNAAQPVLENGKEPASETAVTEPPAADSTKPATESPTDSVPATKPDVSEKPANADDQSDGQLPKL